MGSPWTVGFGPDGASQCYFRKSMPTPLFTNCSV
jgi:hypothetical protein